MAKVRLSVIAGFAAAGLALTACTNTEGDDAASTAAADVETVTIEDNHGTQEVPVDPETVVSLDNRTFEVLADWGVELEAAPVALIPDTIEAYAGNEDILNIGNHREPDLELITAAEPDFILQGQRFTNYYDDIAELNPDAAYVDLNVRDGEPIDQELKRQVTELGKVFETEDEAEQLIADFDAALERAQDAYDSSKTVMAVNVSGGEINYIAPTVGRMYGPLFDLIGMTASLEVEGSSSNDQGDDISVEAIAQSNPDILLVLDRDAAVQSVDQESYAGAAALINDNPALQNVTALQDDAVYIAPADTYTNESIITYTEILNGMADLFESQQ